MSCMEPFVGLTQLLADRRCTWKDIADYVTLVRASMHTVRPSSGLGQRLRQAALGGNALPSCAWLVALELTRAYKGMLAEGGHTVPLSSPDLPMKHLTGCTELQPGLLPPDEEVEGLGWSAQVPRGDSVKYPAVMLGRVHRDRGTAPVYLRMHRFVCWLARGPATAADHEVCHACSNLTCVRPSHLNWGSRSQNVRERPGRKRRR